VPGAVTLSFFSPVPLSAGLAEFARLIATVPASAPCGAAHILDMSDVSINEGLIPATADDSVHVVALLGDTTGNGQYSGLDAQRVARIVVGLDSGLAAFPTIDPIVLADVTGNGGLSGLDAQRIAQQVVGLDPADIPPLPDETMEDVVRSASQTAAAVDEALAQMESADSRNDTASERGIAAPLAELSLELVEAAFAQSVPPTSGSHAAETTAEDAGNRTAPVRETPPMQGERSSLLENNFDIDLETESENFDAKTIDACFAEEAIL
jgi:hypothetical protein